jgi:hypothetical protein
MKTSMIFMRILVNLQRHPVMKHPPILFLDLLYAITSNAQVPQSFSCQAVARNADGSVLTNQSVMLEIPAVH